MAGRTLLENTADPYLPSDEMMIQNGSLLDDNYYDDLRTKRLNGFANEERKTNKKLLKWISLKQFYLDSPISSIFIKINHNQVRLLERDTMLFPYNKSGVAINWFNLNELKDNNIVNLENLEREELKELYNQKRILNKEYKKSINYGTKIKIDTLVNLIENTIAKWEDLINNQKKLNITTIIDSYTSYCKVYLDSLPVELNQCYFYRHPHYDEHGIKCFFNTNHLSNGVHLIKFVKWFLPANSTIIMKDSITLPIIKQ